MSRMWSPAAEVARDKLFDQLMFSGLDAGQRWDLIDDFAHALAEQIRTEVGPREKEAEPEYAYGYNHGMHDAADLIDPRPVSSEENTT